MSHLLFQSCLAPRASSTDNFTEGSHNNPFAHVYQILTNQPKVDTKWTAHTIHTQEREREREGEREREHLLVSWAYVPSPQSSMMPPCLKRWTYMALTLRYFEGCDDPVPRNTISISSRLTPFKHKGISSSRWLSSVLAWNAVVLDAVISSPCVFLSCILPDSHNTQKL